jgi:hypothetical protein
MKEKEDTSFYLEDSHLIFPFILLTSNSKVETVVTRVDLSYRTLRHRQCQNNVDLYLTNTRNGTRFEAEHEL